MAQGVVAAGQADAAASAAAAEPSFALDLAAVIESGDPADATPTVASQAPAAHLAAIEAFSDPNAWRHASSSDLGLQQNQSSQGGGGFGRWMKKRWYIPVIAAVVIGVTIADDNDSGEEDDD